MCPKQCVSGPLAWVCILALFPLEFEGGQHLLDAQLDFGVIGFVHHPTKDRFAEPVATAQFVLRRLAFCPRIRAKPGHEVHDPLFGFRRGQLDPGDECPHGLARGGLDLQRQQTLDLVRRHQVQHPLAGLGEHVVAPDLDQALGFFREEPGRFQRFDELGLGALGRLLDGLDRSGAGQFQRALAPEDRGVRDRCAAVGDTHQEHAAQVDLLERHGDREVFPGYVPVRQHLRRVFTGPAVEEEALGRRLDPPPSEFPISKDADRCCIGITGGMPPRVVLIDFGKTAGVGVGVQLDF